MSTYKYTKLNRRGYEVVLPSSVYSEVKEGGYNIGLTLNTKKEPSSVQLFKNNKYVGTLKEAMGIKAFKDGNPCNFRVSNLIEVDE
mgnify:CR=1 FL=1